MIPRLSRKRQMLLLIVRKAYAKRIRRQPFQPPILRLVWKAVPGAPRTHSVSPFDSRYERIF